MHDVTITAVHPPDQIDRPFTVKGPSDPFTSIFAFHGTVASTADMFFTTDNQKIARMSLVIQRIIMYNLHHRDPLMKSLSGQTKIVFIGGFFLSA
jgi:hypothetical protein